MDTTIELGEPTNLYNGTGKDVKREINFVKIAHDTGISMFTKSLVSIKQD